LMRPSWRGAASSMPAMVNGTVKSWDAPIPNRAPAPRKWRYRGVSWSSRYVPSPPADGRCPTRQRYRRSLT
jgi:hypothetical protein